MNNYTANDIERFWTRVDLSLVDNDFACWVWVAGRHKTGYGLLSVKGKPLKCHRISWELAFGEIPEHLHVLHRCDNRACCNPNHLFLGTNLDNIQDRISKNRSAIGEENGRCKIPDSLAELIRARYAQGNTTHRKLAYEFGVSKSGIAYVLNLRK